MGGGRTKGPSGAGPWAKSGIIFLFLCWWHLAPGLEAICPLQLLTSRPLRVSGSTGEGARGPFSQMLLAHPPHPPRPRAEAMWELCHSHDWAEGEARQQATMGQEQRPHTGLSSSILVTDPRSRTSGDRCPALPGTGQCRAYGRPALWAASRPYLPAPGRKDLGTTVLYSARATWDIREVGAPSCHLPGTWPPGHLLCLVLTPAENLGIARGHDALDIHINWPV